MARHPVSMEDYFRANVEKKLFIKMPRHDDDLDLTPATRLLEKRREMLEVETGLGQQKEEFAMKMESLAQRRDELARKEAQLKESLTKFDKFLKENDAKRSRAMKKSLEERKMKEQKENETQLLKEGMQKLGRRKDNQAKAVETHQAYQRYLESVIEHVGEFGEIKDLIARYDTLSATNSELLERAHVAQEKTEKSRLAFVQSSEEKNNTILNYNNAIAKLQTHLEEAQMASGKWQAQVDNTMKNATQKTLELGQIKMQVRATSNLFGLVKAHLNNRLAPANDTLDQLDKIQQFIIDLSQITAEAAKATAAAQANHPHPTAHPTAHPNAHSQQQQQHQAHMGVGSSVLASVSSSVNVGSSMNTSAISSKSTLHSRG